mmetsp:Transcript_52350/g.87009  ORF Transcript_52350/g.87009 Transcript_52350/m.87009 type:complete len:326 (+) Transcript_52350:37-1014(+)
MGRQMAFWEVCLEPSGERAKVRGDGSSADSTTGETAAVLDKTAGGVVQVGDGRRTPESLGNSTSSGPDTRIKVGLVDLLSKHHSLTTDDEVGVVRGDASDGIMAVHGLPGVNPLVVSGTRKRGLLVEVVAVGVDGTEAGRGDGTHGGRLVPDLIDRLGGHLDASVKEIFPGDGGLVDVGHDGLEVVLVVLEELSGAGHAVLAHPLRDVGVVGPAARDHLVTSNVEAVVGEERRHLGEQRADHVVRKVLCGIQRDVVDVALVLGAVHHELRVSESPTVSVAWGVKLRDDTDAAGLSVADDLGDLLLGVVGHSVSVGSLSTKKRILL